MASIDDNKALMKEWNYEKNGSLKLNIVIANSGKKAWWKCNKGNELEAEQAIYF